jgi:hypothetical protein
VARGTWIEPVPVTGFAANVSPIPRTAPPPLGSEGAGGAPGPVPKVLLVFAGCWGGIGTSAAEARRNPL